MKPIPVAEIPAELFDLKDEPFRSFTDTGWGRFPIALDTANLNPAEFAIYVRISIYADTGQDVPAIGDLASHCCMSKNTAEAAMKTLVARKFLNMDGEAWTLTDPTEWLL